MFSMNIGAIANSLSPEVSQYLNRMTSTDVDLRDHLTALIDGLVDDNIWSKLDKLNVAQTLASDSLLNLVQDDYHSTNINSCAFVADYGFTTDYATTAYLQTGFTESGSSALGESDSTLFTYTQDAAAEVGAEIGAYNSNFFPEWVYDGGAVLSNYLQAFSALNLTYAAGFHAISRTDTSSIHVAVGSSTNSGTASATTKTTPYKEFYVGVYNPTSGLPSALAASEWSDKQYSAHGCGGGLSPTELLLLQARLQTYFTSRGSEV